MKRKIDNLGRLVIPKEMREELKINLEDEVNIELVKDKIIITNASTYDFKERVINYIMSNNWSEEDIEKVSKLLEMMEE